MLNLDYQFKYKHVYHPFLILVSDCALLRNIQYKNKECGMVANETTIHRSSNRIDLSKVKQCLKNLTKKCY